MSEADKPAVVLLYDAVLNKIILDNPFYVDSNQPGIIRGGWLDEMGGFLIGRHAKAVADRLNKSAEAK